LFFSTNGSGPSHIGIYAGNGEFIHESPPGVQVTRLDNPSYQKHFVGARRVLD
jgi:cell wall-associated NlpC family hydrolase